MTIQDALIVATVAALLSVSAFVVTYALRARATRWRDLLGQAHKLGGLAVGGLAAVGTVRRIDTRIDAIDLSRELVVGSTIAYLAVAAVWLYKTLVVIRETDHDDEGGDQ